MGIQPVGIYVQAVAVGGKIQQYILMFDAQENMQCAQTANALSIGRTQNNIIKLCIYIYAS